MSEEFIMPTVEEGGTNDKLFQHGGELLHFDTSVRAGILGSKASMEISVHTGAINQEHNNSQTRQVE
jgi:hypothetical protein